MALNMLQRARLEGTPFVDGEAVTFFWHGAAAPRLMGDFCDWENNPVGMQRAGKNHWIYRLQLPVDAYMEYAFLDGENRLVDPFNLRRTPNGVGKYNNYFYMPEGKPTELTAGSRRKQVVKGTISQHVVPCLGMVTGKQRTVYLYQPADPGPHPLVVVWDGKDYLQRARLPVMLDNLIAQQRIQPVALAMVQNGGRARWIEYNVSESTLIFLVTQVLPLAEKHLHLTNLQQSPGAYAVLGASMGGLMAMYAGLRLPHIFGRVLSQSGAFMLHDAWRDLIMELPRAFGTQGQKIWMDVGLYDFPSLLTGNRVLHQLLRENGYEVKYREYPAGHNYPAWRDDIWRGLEFLFPATFKEIRDE